MYSRLKHSLKPTTPWLFWPLLTSFHFCLLLLSDSATCFSHLNLSHSFPPHDGGGSTPPRPNYPQVCFQRSLPYTSLSLHLIIYSLSSASSPFFSFMSLTQFVTKIPVSICTMPCSLTIAFRRVALVFGLIMAASQYLGQIVNK